MKSLLSFGIMLVTLSIAACGGNGDTLTGGGTGGTGSTGGTGGTGGTVTVDMGSGTPPGFSAGIIAIQNTNLAAGGATSLTITFVDSNSLLYTQNVDVSFSSPCLATNLANINGSTSTNTGILIVTYSATGCSGADVINATANISGVNLATGTVTVAPAAVGSIQFLSAIPDQIALKGTGGVETSTVMFTVVDSTGGPVAGIDVDFTLNTTVGGISLTPMMATSGIDGAVQTVVQSGTVATTLRVTATITGLGISTQSSQLVITTGLPDQDSMSLAVECPNIEAAEYDGVQVPVTIRLGDRFGNPVPDGTAVTFNTEGGKIDGGCTTMTTTQESGVCSVNWTSQEPRPADGRITILATATGEETFVDNNTNGIFDDGDSFTDLDEAYRDDNENSVYDPGPFDVGDGFFFDFYTAPPVGYTVGDGLFNGLLCGHSTLCSANETSGIGASAIIIMSSSTVIFPRINLNGVDYFSPYGPMTLNAPGSLIFDVSGPNLQPPPAGTTIKVNSDNGKTIGLTDFTTLCTSVNGALTYSVFFNTDGTASTGFISIVAETPLGVISQSPIIQIDD